MSIRVEQVTVSVNHYAAYHSPLNFTRPNEFIPERFINTADFPNDRREVLQPFSVGPRNCIGRRCVHGSTPFAGASLLFQRFRSYQLTA